MGVILTFNKQKAFLRDGEWRCADRKLEAHLNGITTRWIEETGGPKLDADDPELEAAEEIALRIGGRVLLQSRADRNRSARIYFRRRQYKLAF